MRVENIQLMIKNYKFLGGSSEIALVIAGIHGSEISGVEVAHWLRVKLQKRIDKDKWKPNFTTIIVPEVFPKSVELTRSCRNRKAKPTKKPDKRCVLSQNGREVLWVGKNKKMYAIPPNRQCPPPGQPLSYLLKGKEYNLQTASQQGPTDPGGNHIREDASRPPQIMKENVPLLPETVEILKLIELTKPKRIASIHAHSVIDRPDYGCDAPGIFVDPRYNYGRKEAQQNPLEPIGSSKINLFGADVCKFDLTTEPAAPVIGLIKQLFEFVAKRTDPDALEAKADIEEAAKLFREEAKARKPPNVECRPHKGSMIKATEAANKLKKIGFKQLDRTAISAFTPEGRDDDRLALEIAKVIYKQFPKLVPGNHLGKPIPVVHYAASAGNPQGFSFGDWGPVKVKQSKDSGNRDGAPVITIEVYGYKESGAFSENGEQLVEEDCKTPTQLWKDQHPNVSPEKSKLFDKERCKRLQAYAEALIQKFLT